MGLPSNRPLHGGSFPPSSRARRCGNGMRFHGGMLFSWRWLSHPGVQRYSPRTCGTARSSAGSGSSTTSRRRSGPREGTGDVVGAALSTFPGRMSQTGRHAGGPGDLRPLQGRPSPSRNRSRTRAAARAVLPDAEGWARICGLESGRHSSGGFEPALPLGRPYQGAAPRGRPTTLAGSAPGFGVSFCARPL